MKPTASQPLPEKKRWDPWPVSIFVFFVVAIAGCVTFVAFSNLHPTDLVAVDYYEQELKYQRHIDQVARTRELGAQAQIGYDASQQRIRITLPQNPSSSPSSMGGEVRAEKVPLNRPMNSPEVGSDHVSPESPAVVGSIQLYRPSAASMDRELNLELDAQGTQIIDAAKLPAGLWQVRVSWTAGGKNYYSDKTLVLPSRSLAPVPGAENRGEVDTHGRNFGGSN